MIEEIEIELEMLFQKKETLKQKNEELHEKIKKKKNA